MRTRLAGAIALASVIALVVPTSGTAQVFGTDVTYTTDADFDLGTLVGVNHDPPFNDQLQLDSPTRPFPFINVAASGRGTVVRVNTETGEVLGEYHTAPEGRGLDPSRTTVDLFGSVWTANRAELDEIDGVPHGSAVKIGLLVGGTRVDGAGLPAPSGEYVAPPFDYNTCADRDGDGLIRSSGGLYDVLDWPDVTDGLGGADGVVDDALDECILVYQRLPDAEAPRHVSVDADNNVWVGGYPFDLRSFHLLDGTTGAILQSFDARDIGCGGYGGLVDGNGILWSIGGGWGEGPLLRYDPATDSGTCVNTSGGYGLGVDTNGYVWASLWDNGIVKVAPDGNVEPGYPKSTFVPPSTTTAGGFAPQMALPRRPLPLPRADDAPEAAPDFWAAPDDDWVGSMNAWAAGATISLTIENGSGVVYADSQTATAGGDFQFNLWESFDLQRGHLVTVSDGTTTKTHTVTNLFVDGIDVTADTVYGRADPGTDVHVWLHQDGNNLTVTADGAGNWVADFSATSDLTYASDGGSQQTDADGDSTGVWWAGPTFTVVPDGDSVQSMSRWTPGTTVSLTIEDGSGVAYADSQTVDSTGHFNFDLWDGFDVQRGHIVTVSDGTATKSHTVQNYFVDGIDVAADTVFGRADPGTDVHVWVHQDDSNLTVTTDGAGNWVADFSGLTDLTYLSDGNSMQSDDDGDGTWVFWTSPRFTASPDDDWVGSTAPWTPGSTVSLTIEDGSGIIYADSQTVAGDGNFNFNLWEVFDVQRGHIVTVSDGTTTKTHTVTNLFVDGIDAAADTVFGRADPGTDVDVWLHQDGSNVTVTADGSGNWVADFSATSDLTYASDGGAQQTDADGDSTGVWWAGPTFTVAPDDDWIGSMSRWTPGSTVSLTIEDGSGVVYADSQTVDSMGNFNFNLWEAFDVERGHIVTVSDGTTTKIHTVIDLFVDGIDVTADTVYGRADPGTQVDVWLHQDDSNLTVTADGAGNWVAHFSGLTDLTYLSDGNSMQSDDDGDGTSVFWASPRFSVSPDDDWVGPMTRWTPGSTVSLTIEDGSGIIYADSRTVAGDGYFDFNLWNVFDVQRGHIVTVSDGTTTKTHTVIDLYVDGIDADADMVFGHGIPNWPVDVFVHDHETMLTVAADDTGAWNADFSGLVDITFGIHGDAQQLDDDGDGTTAPWSVRNPTIVVYRDQGSLRGEQFEPFATVTIGIDGVPVGSVTTDEGGHFWFNHDVAIGQVVTADDGTTVKSHVVTSHTIGVVDHVANTASGTAVPLSVVTVEIEGSPVNIHREVQADAGGVWFTDFDVPGASGQTDDITPFTTLYVWQTDDDGDNTTVSWHLPNFTVDLDYNGIDGGWWAPDATVAISVDGAPLESVVTDPYGSFGIGSEIDLVPGQLVTVEGPAHTKTLVIADLTVTAVDVAGDTVSGTATPGDELEVLVYEFDRPVARKAVADATGNWTVDFSVPGTDPTNDDWENQAWDIRPETLGWVNEWDDDGDVTVKRFGPPTQANRGVAVTPIDNHVWVANSGVGTITRLDSDGNVLAVIDVGDEPTGVAVDAAGKVWATNLGSDNAVRIDPNAGADGLGAVDLTVDLGAGSAPYNYSDMTGAVVVGSTSRQGFWTVVQDSGQAGFEWGRITWNTEPEASEPTGSEILVEVRAADTEAGLGAEPFVAVPNGELFASTGRYIEVRVTLKASPEGFSPVLSDIRVQPAVIDVDVDIKPSSDPNTINIRRTRGVIPVAVLGSAEFDVATIDVATLAFGPDGAAPTHDLTVMDDHYADVDLDGYLDLVSHYTIGETGLASGDSEACLVGATLDGVPIAGCDSVKIK
jgi:hypothetical protein